jgi:hypothetical protein
MWTGETTRKSFKHLNQTGNDPGNLLWSHFDLLRKTGMATVPSKSTHPAPVRSGEKRQAQEDLFSDVPKSAKKQRVVLGKYEEGKVLLNCEDASNVHRSGIDVIKLFFSFVTYIS